MRKSVAYKDFKISILFQHNNLGGPQLQPYRRLQMLWSPHNKNTKNHVQTFTRLYNTKRNMKLILTIAHYPNKLILTRGKLKIIDLKKQRIDRRIQKARPHFYPTNIFREIGLCFRVQSQTRQKYYIQGFTGLYTGCFFIPFTT